jgi:hypothetical protein
MQNLLNPPIVGVIAVLVFSTVVVAQTPKPPTPQAQPDRRYGVSNLNDQQSKNTTPAGPAPKRDLLGVWAGPTDSTGHNFPPMTALGAARFKLNKPEPVVTIAASNDPLTVCDPLGFPRNIMNETRGMMFAQLPDRMLILYQYQRVWREIWMDGRALPKSIDTKGGAPSNFYGYSVGHWDGDYTFVIETVGLDDRTWMDKQGHPHSADLHVEERYTRVDQKTLRMTVTITDPKIYTKPFEELTDVTFRWNPKQQLDEQICVPSEGLAYMSTIGRPAGTGGRGQ